LIDVISNGIGTIYKPRAIRKEADAEAYKIKVIEKARTQSLIESKLSYEELEGNIIKRLAHKEARKQKNIETVNFIAAEQLQYEEEVSDEPVDDDWTTRFFNIVEDISNDEMQNLWGRILAGEVKKPKSYSLRTLELLKNLSKEEAEVFTKFANIKIVSGDKNMICNQDNGKFLEEQFGISFLDRLLLAELGLIASENNLEFHFTATNNSKHTGLLTYGQKGLVLKRSENTPKQPMKVLIFTKTGAELSNLINQPFNHAYLERVCSIFKHKNVTIEYGDLVTINGQLLLNTSKIYDK